ncbi:MAG: hypothetical protein R6W70_05490, partial [bacterium]
MLKILFFLVFFLSFFACSSDRSSVLSEKGADADGDISKEDSDYFDSEKYRPDISDKNSESHLNDYDFEIDENFLDEDNGYYENDKKNDEKISDYDIIPENVRYFEVTKEGGDFNFFSESVYLSFPSGWIDENKIELILTEHKRASDYEIYAPVTRFRKQITFNLKGNEEQIPKSEENILTEIKEGEILRINGGRFDGEFFSGNIIGPGRYAVRGTVTAVCPGGMMEIETERVYYFGELISVDTCMDKYEESAAPVGSIGNTDQSSAWPDGCERTGSCGDGSTTSIVNPVEGVLPMTDVSWYQAVVLCQNTGKILCPEIVWQVGCEGEYDPLDPHDKPCNYGVAGKGCYSLDEESCFLKKNKEEAESEYNETKYFCEQEYEHCSDSPEDCFDEKKLCMDAAKEEYEAHFFTGSYKSCCSVTGACDMLGNAWEMILYENEDEEVIRGVMRGGSYVQGEGSSDLKCRPESGYGAPAPAPSTVIFIGLPS